MLALVILSLLALGLLSLLALGRLGLLALARLRLDLPALFGLPSLIGLLGFLALAFFGFLAPSRLRLFALERFGVDRSLLLLAGHHRDLLEPRGGWGQHSASHVEQGAQLGGPLDGQPVVHALTPNEMILGDATIANALLHLQQGQGPFLGAVQAAMPNRCGRRTLIAPVDGFPVEGLFGDTGEGPLELLLDAGILDDVPTCGVIGGGQAAGRSIPYHEQVVATLAANLNHLPANFFVRDGVLRFALAAGEPHLFTKPRLVPRSRSDGSILSAPSSDRGYNSLSSCARTCSFSPSGLHRKARSHISTALFRKPFFW